MKIAIQGFTGSYHAMAAEKIFGRGYELVMCDSFVNLFKTLEKKEAHGAIMAIENTIAGTILFNYALLRNSAFVIVAETFLRVEHCLMALPGQTIYDIKEVRSHPMALMQCHAFLGMYPHIKLVEDVDTAYVAEKMAEQHTLGVAAIAGEGAAQKFGLQILEKNIEDSERNFTRFFVLAPKSAPERLGLAVTSPNKATLCFSLPHQKGALNQVLTLFAHQGINVMALNSTPYVGNAWEYFFYVDIEFEALAQYRAVAEKLGQCTLTWQPLGIYAKGIE